MTTGRCLRLDGLVRLVDVELHAVELLQQVVGELDVGLVDLVDQQHGALVQRERLPQLALADVVADVADARVAELAVAQPAHRVVLVEALQRLGGRLDVPLDERRLDRLGDLQRQHGLAGAGLALHQQRPLQGDGGVDGDLEIVGRDVVLRALELHDAAHCLPAGQTTRELTGAQVALQAGAGGRAKRRRHFQAAFGSGALRRAWGENAGKSVAAGPSNRRSCGLPRKATGEGRFSRSTARPSKIAALLGPEFLGLWKYSCQEILNTT